VPPRQRFSTHQISVIYSAGNSALQAQQLIGERSYFLSMTETQSLKAISGRATGVLFFAGFGSLWLGTWLAAMHKFNFLTGVLVGIVLDP